MVMIFDGNKFANHRKIILKEALGAFGKPLRVVSVYFREDKMGQVYTNLKAKAAQEVGIVFEGVELSFVQSAGELWSVVDTLSRRDEVNGLLIQKPNRQLWQDVRYEDLSYEEWWGNLTGAIDPKKDVDCLTRVNLDKVYAGESDFLPATAKAVVSILNSVIASEMNRKWIVVLGRSELVGKPLAAYLRQLKARVDMLGTKDDLSVVSMADVVISATGHPNLIIGEMMKEGVVVIDVGEPKGDMEFKSVSQKASFITPVPGGVGPVTVVSLLENLVKIYLK